MVNSEEFKKEKLAIENKISSLISDFKIKYNCGYIDAEVCEIGSDRGNWLIHVELSAQEGIHKTKRCVMAYGKKLYEGTDEYDLFMNGDY